MTNDGLNKPPAPELYVSASIVGVTILCVGAGQRSPGSSGWLPARSAFTSAPAPKMRTERMAAI